MRPTGASQPVSHDYLLSTGRLSFSRCAADIPMTFIRTASSLSHHESVDNHPEAIHRCIPWGRMIMSGSAAKINSAAAGIYEVTYMLL